MNLGCIYHRSQDNMCYAKNESELVIQIQTGKEVDRVFLNYEDPMESEEFGGPWTWKGHPEEMLQVRELENHKWWTISVFLLINAAVISLSSGAGMKPVTIWRMGSEQTVPL